MKRLITLAVALTFFVVPQFESETVSAQQRKPRPIEEKDKKPEAQAALRVEVEQVQVDVTVQDRKGNLITGLQRQHFEVYEDKVAQEITAFAPVEAPMTAVLVVEYSKAIVWEMLYEAWLGSQIFAQGMREGDWIAVVAYDIRPEILVDFTQDRSEVQKALRRLNYPAFSESNLYDTVADTLDRLEEVQGKVAMVLVSSGLDTFSKLNLGEILKKTKKTNVAIYPVALGGNFLARNDMRLGAITRLDFLQAESTLKAFAKFTGGQAYFPRFSQAFPSIFQTISAVLRSQYTLAYVSTNPSKDGKYRKIKVNVSADVNGDGKPDKLKIHHKQGYLADPR